MVFVKVRETYDLHTLKNKLSVIGIHTPGASLIKRNYPGLLMQCKAYRPVSITARLACASMMPLGVQEVGVADGDVAPEDVFNPILYKAVSNFSMSQIEQLLHTPGLDPGGDLVDWKNDGVMASDDFGLYYGLLSDTHGWKHANPQAGLEMRDLVPLVYETYQNIGDNTPDGASAPLNSINPDGNIAIGNIPVQTFRGKPHPVPWINCTYPKSAGPAKTEELLDIQNPGFAPDVPPNAQTDVPAPKIMCGCIIVPPSRLHTLFYRLVVEATLEFSTIRSLAEITTFGGLNYLGNNTHFMSYNYDSKDVLKEETSLVDTTEGSEIHKVM